MSNETKKPNEETTETKAAAPAGVVLTGTPPPTPEQIEQKNKRIAALEAELKALKEGTPAQELSEEEKKTGLHASNAPAPSPKVNKNLKAPEGKVHPYYGTPV